MRGFSKHNQWVEERSLELRNGIASKTILASPEWPPRCQWNASLPEAGGCILPNTLHCSRCPLQEAYSSVLACRQAPGYTKCRIQGQETTSLVVVKKAGGCCSKEETGFSFLYPMEQGLLLRYIWCPRSIPTTLTLVLASSLPKLQVFYVLSPLGACLFSSVFSSLEPT